MNQATRPGGIAIAVLRKCVAGNLGEALKVVRALVVQPLLLTKRLDDQSRRLAPVGIEARGVAGRLPVAMREAHRIAQRIDFPLPFVQLGLHRGADLCPIRCRWGRS